MVEGPFWIDPQVNQPSRLHSSVTLALTLLIRSVKQEACFGLFGHWGRGKTFIARAIGKQIASTHQIIFFSAWRYPNSPENWAFLYELMLSEMRKDGEMQYVGTIIRQNIIRKGIIPAVVAHMSAFIAFIGLNGLLGGIHFLLAIFGISTLLIFMRFWFSGRRIVSRLLENYIYAQSHRSVLGLQETIGGDIRALLSARVARHGESIAGLRLLIALLAVLTVALPGIYTSITAYPKGPSLYDFIDYPAFWVWLVWSAAVIGVALVAVPWSERKPILLVVDDLDRCPPRDSLRIIESIMLLLDPSLQQAQIQVLILIDESTLEEGIREKFGSGSKLRSVLGHIEKMFTAYVRLPSLGVDDFSTFSKIFLLTDERDRAIATVEATGKRERDCVSRRDVENLKIKDIENELKGLPPKIEYKVLESKRGLGNRGYYVYHGGRRLINESGPLPVHEEEVVKFRPRTENEVSEWRADAEFRLREAELKLEETKKEVEQYQSENAFAVNKLDSINQVLETELAVKIDTLNDIASALSYSESEKNLLLNKINSLPGIANFDWGPRSAHVAMKKYLLLKSLWIALAGSQMALDESETLQLVEALFAAIKSRMVAPGSGEDECAAGRSGTWLKMLKTAHYVA